MWHLRKRIRTSIVVAIIISAIKGNAQVNELKTASVHEYLYRMAQKGLIRFQDYQLPLDRKTISAAIDSLATHRKELSKTEASELKFYQQEYAFDRFDSSREEKTLFRKDSFNRFRIAKYEKGSTKIFVDPLIELQFLKAGNKNASQYFSGIRLAGYFGKRWGFNFAFRDNTEKGDTLTHLSMFSPVEGIIQTGGTSRSVNYSSVNYNIGYRWSNGSLSVGQENFAWGYGMGGNIVLSAKSPSFPFIKFDFQPWTWLHFNYFHGWLQSNIIDSARSYNTGTGLYGGKREIYISKFIVHHSVTATPLKGLDISIGESMIYSDKLNFAYLIPINFFKVYDHYNSRYNINAGDNSQFFGFISSRNHIKNTHIYAQLFVDEIRASKIFNKKERKNQLGYTLGVNKTDLFLHYLTAGIEYSRINPFVYNNLMPMQTYESNSYSIGDWMGSNADRLYLFAQYVPLPRLRIKLWNQTIRKGEKGTLDQQYNQIPQLHFLFKKLFDYKETGLSARYEAANRLFISMELNAIRIKYNGAPVSVNKGFHVGINYGL
jgi:hypothetical protein